MLHHLSIYRSTILRAIAYWHNLLCWDTRDSFLLLNYLQVLRRPQLLTLLAYHGKHFPIRAPWDGRLDTIILLTELGVVLLGAGTLVNFGATVRSCLLSRHSIVILLNGG